MALVNSNGYVMVKSQTKTPKSAKPTYRTFWIGRQVLALEIRLPSRYWGKRIALKVIEIDKEDGGDTNKVATHTGS